MAATSSPLVRGPADANETVLIVDDDESVLRAVTRVLSGRPYLVEAFSDASEAALRIRRGGIGVVVSDITMPGMTGLMLLRIIREHDPDLPVVLLTGLPTLETATEAIDYGVFKYLTKPVDLTVLRDTIGRALKLHRLARMKREALALLGVSSGPSDRAGLEAMFERALSSMWIAFQPIVRATDGTVFGYEALLRSGDPSLPGPVEVLSAAERLGELMHLGSRVRNLTAAPIQDAGESCALFVNLHPNDLFDPHLVDVSSPLARIANRVVLEITERASLSRVDDVRVKAARLRELGFRIAVNDLGAGYAGFSGFALLEPAIVKLDMKLVRGIDTNPGKQKVVASMTSFCKDMGMQIVAEGVETSAERDKVIALGCDLLQGYLFARPGPPFPAPKWA